MIFISLKKSDQLQYSNYFSTISMHAHRFRFHYCNSPPLPTINFPKYPQEFANSWQLICFIPYTSSLQRVLQAHPVHHSSEHPKTTPPSNRFLHGKCQHLGYRALHFLFFLFRIISTESLFRSQA